MPTVQNADVCQRTAPTLGETPHMRKSLMSTTPKLLYEPLYKNCDAAYPIFVAIVICQRQLISHRLWTRIVCRHVVVCSGTHRGSAALDFHSYRAALHVRSPPTDLPTREGKKSKSPYHPYSCRTKLNKSTSEQATSGFEVFFLLEKVVGLCKVCTVLCRADG